MSSCPIIYTLLLSFKTTQHLSKNPREQLRSNTPKRLNNFGGKVVNCCQLPSRAQTQMYIITVFFIRKTNSFAHSLKGLCPQRRECYQFCFRIPSEVDSGLILYVMEGLRIVQTSQKLNFQITRQGTDMINARGEGIKVNLPFLKLDKKKLPSHSYIRPV